MLSSRKNQRYRKLTKITSSDDCDGGEKAILSVSGLSSGYGRKPELNNVGFAVERGALWGLLGPNASGKTTLLKCLNGSGKTTLMRCINGILKPLQGVVTVAGQEIRNMKREEIARAYCSHAG